MDILDRFPYKDTYTIKFNLYYTKPSLCVLYNKAHARSDKANHKIHYCINHVNILNRLLAKSTRESTWNFDEQTNKM